MITIQGGAPLHPAEHTVMGDRIAAATYLCAVGAAGGELRLTGVDPADLAAVCCCLEEAGCRLHTDGEGLSIAASGPVSYTQLDVYKRQRWGRGMW